MSKKSQKSQAPASEDSKAMSLADREGYVTVTLNSDEEIVEGVEDFRPLSRQIIQQNESTPLLPDHNVDNSQNYPSILAILGRICPCFSCCDNDSHGE